MDVCKTTMQAQLETREERGKAIFEAGKQIKKISGHEYEVLSQNANGFYRIVAVESGWMCTCPDFSYRHTQCKHIFAVKISLQFRREVHADRIEPIADASACIFCGSTDIRKDGVRHNKYGDLQKFQCRVCNKYFTFNLGFEQMKHSPQAITSAMQLYFSGESLRNTQKSLKLLGVQVSHQTIHNWISKYVELMQKYVEKISPKVSGVWRADELYVKVKGNPKYLFALIDDQTRFWLAEQIADKKGMSDVRPLFEAGKELVGRKPDVLITDGAQNFRRAFKKAYYHNVPDKNSVHMRHIHIKGDLNNNRMERFNEEIRTREKIMRSLKTEDSPIIEGMRLYHNFFRPHMALKGQTPASKAGIQIDGENKWKTVIQNASLAEQPTKFYKWNNQLET